VGLHSRVALHSLLCFHLDSGAEGKPAGSGVVGVELGKDGAACPPSQGALERIHEDEVLSSSPAYSKPPPKTPVEQKVLAECFVLCV